ncbi:signal recognition particle 9 kDa protein-domain-containing protein [Apiospora phragmitis]|uniref:Signal recognition particle 9 kDa protein-domain-containing protein n=1 Tax=Apiospora phragmitis TaxID=2905665 RepID=A0ABR1VYZ3_9PEZI
MPHYAKSEEWLRESQRLLEARPTTTRITTKYSIKTPKVRKPKPTDAAAEPTTTTAAAAKPARGCLALKTYDPVSGVTLKYRTSKAAEVSRLILCLGKLSRPMAGLPELKDEIMADAPANEEGTPAAEKSEAAATTTSAAPAAQQQPTPAAGGGGKGKKKKGKK